MRKYTSALLAALVLVTVILSGCSEGIGAPEEISRSNASTSQNAPVSSASSSAANQNNVSSSKQKDGEWVKCDESVFNLPPTYEEDSFSDTFDGKSKTDYEIEADTSGAILFWVEGVSYSPTGHYAVFSSNRNCLKAQGMSIFLIDRQGGEESLLVDGSDDNYYSGLGWLPDEEHFVVQVSNASSQSYQICDLTGKMQRVSIQYEDSTILALRDDVIVFSDRTDQSAVNCAQLNSKGLLSELGSYVPANGFLMGECEISPDLRKVAFKIRTDYEHSDRYITVWDIVSDEEKILPNPDIDGSTDVAAIDLNWDTQYLCVNFNVIKEDGTNTDVPLQWITE